MCHRNSSGINFRSPFAPRTKEVKRYRRSPKTTETAIAAILIIIFDYPLPRRFPYFPFSKRTREKKDNYKRKKGSSQRRKKKTIKNLFGRDMSALESALDVLSRAATMVQEERPKSTELHRRPSNARRKERRMDPIQNEALDMSTGKTVSTTFLRPSVIISSTSQPARINNWDTLNRQRSSTSDTIDGKKTCSIYDPAIDEHFKRSLGAEKYAAVFHATGTDKEVGLSVDDHFAKSLGDQWATLKEPVERRSTSNHISVPTRSINSFPSLHCCSSCGLSDHVTSP